MAFWVSMNMFKVPLLVQRKKSNNVGREKIIKKKRNKLHQHYKYSHRCKSKQDSRTVSNFTSKITSALQKRPGFLMDMVYMPTIASTGD